MYIKIGIQILKAAIHINGIRQLFFYLSNIDVYRFMEYYKTLQSLENISEQNSYKKMLDLGSGYSILPSLLPVICIDVNKRTCEWQRSNSDAEVLISDMCALPIKSESIDIVTAISSIEHVPNDLAVYEEINRILKKDGYLLMSFAYSAVKGEVIKGLRKGILINLLNSKHLIKLWRVLLSSKNYYYFIEQTQTDFLNKVYARDELHSIINHFNWRIEEEIVFGKKIFRVFFRIFPPGWFVVKDFFFGYVFYVIEKLFMKNDADGNTIWLRIRK